MLLFSFYFYWCIIFHLMFWFSSFISSFERLRVILLLLLLLRPLLFADVRRYGYWVQWLISPCVVVTTWKVNWLFVYFLFIYIYFSLYCCFGGDLHVGAELTFLHLNFKWSNDEYWFLIPKTMAQLIAFSFASSLLFFCCYKDLF